MTDEIATAEPNPNLPARKQAGVPRTAPKPIKLPPNREAFLQAYLDTGKKARAYRIAYKIPEGKDDAWIYSEAWKLMRIPQVARRLEQIKAERAAAMVVNGQTLVAELEQARNLAMELDQPSTAVSATMGKARITGHVLTPEGNLGGKGGGQNGGVNAGVNIQIVFNATDTNLL